MQQYVRWKPCPSCQGLYPGRGTCVTCQTLGQVQVWVEGPASRDTPSARGGTPGTYEVRLGAKDYQRVGKLIESFNELQQQLGASRLALQQAREEADELLATALDMAHVAQLSPEEQGKTEGRAIAALKNAVTFAELVIKCQDERFKILDEMLTTYHVWRDSNLHSADATAKHGSAQ